MSGLQGAPDFQSQTTASLRFIESVDINAALQQDISLSGELFPNDQSLVLFWIATGGFVFNPCVVNIVTTAPVFTVASRTRIFSGDYLTIPMFGALVTNSQVGSFTIQVIKPTGVGGPIIGTLVIFAQQAAPTISPVVRLTSIGLGGSTNLVNVASLATTTILATAPDGMYYRLKCLSWHTAVAPAALARVTWSDGGVTAIVTGVGSAALTQSQVSLDVQNSNGVVLTNNLSVTISGCVAYELWANH